MQLDMQFETRGGSTPLV